MNNLEIGVLIYLTLLRIAEVDGMYDSVERKFIECVFSHCTLFSLQILRKICAEMNQHKREFTEMLGERIAIKNMDEKLFEEWLILKLENYPWLDELAYDIMAIGIIVARLTDTSVKIGEAKFKETRFLRRLLNTLGVTNNDEIKKIHNLVLRYNEILNICK